MNPAHLPDQIEQWLHDKDVEALTSDEQELVIQALGSLEAYRRLRLVASRSQEALNAGRISPAGSTLGAILSKVAAQEPEHALPRIRMSIPLYQAAASVVLAVALTWWWATFRPGVQPEPVVITLVDTVYQEVVRVDTVAVSPGKEVATKSHLTAKQESQSWGISNQTLERPALQPDYRFSRGEHTLALANRQGLQRVELNSTRGIDSVLKRNTLFQADRLQE